MPTYYLNDGTSTYNIDNNVLSVDLGTPKRKYKPSPYAGTDGARIKGIGTYSHREITISKRFYNVAGPSTWESTRLDFWKWINRASWETLYFYIDHDDGTVTRARCWPGPGGSESYSYIKVSGAMDFKFLCEKPYFQKTTDETASLTVIDATEHSKAITNDGTYQTAPKFTFTPTSDISDIEIEIANDFGFALRRNFFNAGEAVVFDCSDGSMTINGSPVSATQFRTRGSTFKIPVGNTTVYIRAGAGSLTINWPERYI